MVAIVAPAKDMEAQVDFAVRKDDQKINLDVRCTMYDVRF
jgi:hypothetical protein